MGAWWGTACHWPALGLQGSRVQASVRNVCTALNAFTDCKGSWKDSEFISVVTCLRLSVSHSCPRLE